MDIVIMVRTWDFWPNDHYVYPIYNYIQCISLNSLSLNLIYDCIHCQYIYLHKYNQISNRIELYDIYNVKYEIMGAKEGQKSNIRV